MGSYYVRPSSEVRTFFNNLKFFILPRNLINYFNNQYYVHFKEISKTDLVMKNSFNCSNKNKEVL